MTPDEAGNEILGLVCGFPGERAWQRQLLMLKDYKIFIDGSGTGAPDFLVLAGYIATARVWIDFSTDWQERLDHARLPYFKMCEMAQTPQRLETAGYFYQTIDDHDISAAVSCVIRTSDLVKVVRNINWPTYFTDIEALENPYYFAFRAIIDCLSQHQDKLGLTEPIDFIFDEETEEKFTRQYFKRMMMFSEPKVRDLLGDIPIYRKDEKTPPLQAADLYAWWVRKWRIAGDTDGLLKLKFPWRVRKNIPRLDMEFAEKDFKIEFDKMLTFESLDRAIASKSNGTFKGIKITLPFPSW